MNKSSWLVAGTALLCACGSSMVDELGAPAAADTGCHILPEAVSARFPEVARTFGLEMQEKSRALTIGIDSANRVRVLTTSVHQKRMNILTVRAAGVMFDAEGRMTKASRTVTTGDIESKAASSSIMPILPADTGRARALAMVALQRCVK